MPGRQQVWLNAERGRKNMFKWKKRLAIGVGALLLTGVLIGGAAWRLGLLPLLLYHPAGQAGLLLGAQDHGRQLPSTAGSAGEQPGASGKTAGDRADSQEKTSEHHQPALSDYNSNGTKKPQLQLEIENRHVARLRSIAGRYEGALNSLVAQAWSEYGAVKDRGNRAVLGVAEKYLSAGNALESRCDAQFYSELSAFAAELRSHGYPTDTVELAKREYQYAKAARKQEILSAAARSL